MKNRTMRLVSCAILSLVVHTGLAATFFYAVKPKPVTLEISNPIRVSLVDHYSSAIGSKNDNSLSSDLLGNSAHEFVNETNLNENGRFDLSIVEIQMVAAIDLQDEIATLDPQSEIIEDFDTLQAQYAIEEFVFNATIESNFETEDDLTKEKSESAVSKLNETSTGGKIPLTEHAGPVRLDNQSNESQIEHLELSNDSKPPESIKPKINLQTMGIYSHLEQGITARDTSVNERPPTSLDPIEPESLSQIFSDYQATAVDSAQADNTDNTDYDPVSPDFDSEFVRWAQLDLESISYTELDKNSSTKNIAVDQTLSPEVFQSIGKFEGSLSAAFNNSIPAEVSQETSQHPSQPASNSDNGERSDTNQLVENSIAHLRTQKTTEPLIQQQPSHVDSETNRESSDNSPAPIHSQKVASIAGASAYSSPKYGVEGFPNPAPRYPYLSRANGEEGKVILQVVVDRYGLASEITIVQSSGYRRLDKAATKAVKKWEFLPALKGGFKVQGIVQVSISFVLRDS